MRACAPPVAVLLVGLLAPTVRSQQNVLLVIADDVGVDRVAAYGEHPEPGRTPNIDALAAQGVLFRNAWSNPWCSPSRATILTGRYSFRTGIGMVIPDEGTWDGLSIVERALPRALGPDVHSEAVGKWHLATLAQGGLHPLEVGFRHHRGALSNLRSYFTWEKWVDGEPGVSTTYATTDTVDDAIHLVRNLEGPWFIWMATNAPHGPVHAPPDPLHSFELSGDPTDSEVLHVKAMIEALDTELGRLFAEVGPETTIVFVGDNGTTDDATDAPFDPNHAKGTVYEGGINVPLIIAGPAVASPGSECAALVNTTDLYATVIELARAADAPSVPAVHHGALDPVYRTRDSVSLVPYLADPDLSLRETVYAEAFVPNGLGAQAGYHRAIRGKRFKLVQKLNRPDELYDLLLDPFEQEDLLLSPLSSEAEAAYDRLTFEIGALLSS